MANMVDKRGSRASINEKHAKKDKKAGMSQTTLSKGLQPNSTSPNRKRGVASKIEIEPTSPNRKRSVGSKIENEPTSPNRKRGVASKIEIEPTSPNRKNRHGSKIENEPTSPNRKRGVASKIEIEPTSPNRKNRHGSKIETETTSPTKRNKITSSIDIEDHGYMKNWKDVINDEKKATNLPGFQVYSVQAHQNLRSIKDINVADLEMENVISQDKPSRKKLKEKSRKSGSKGTGNSTGRKKFVRTKTFQPEDKIDADPKEAERSSIKNPSVKTGKSIKSMQYPDDDLPSRSP
jgi:hypothetical protein